MTSFQKNEVHYVYVIALAFLYSEDFLPALEAIIEMENLKSMNRC